MGTEPDYVEIAENRVIGSTLKYKSRKISIFGNFG
jgi:hypothetical protein